MTRGSVFSLMVSVFVVVSFFSACNKEERHEINQVVFSVNNFQFIGDDEIDTKTSLRNGTEFIWSAKDTVGIYPNTGSQVFFAMTSGAGASSATFDGGGWDFKPSSVYYSYYPFIGDIYLDRHHIPVTYLGQHQPTATDIEHIGPYDYMVTPAASSSNGNLHFSYAHLNCLIRVTASLPSGTYTRMSIISPDEDFALNGYYDLMSSTPRIVSTKVSDTISIDLDYIAVSEGTPLVVYLMSAPVNLKDKDITVVFTADNGTIYSQTKTPSRNYEAESIGGLTCNEFTGNSGIANGVNSEDTVMGEDDEVLTINQ